MGKSLWFLLFCVWFGLLLGGVAKASDVPSGDRPSEPVIQTVSCQDFTYFRYSCGALLKVLAQDVLAQAKAVRVSGAENSLK